MEREAYWANITCDSQLGGKHSTESDNGLYRLSCRGSTQMWFDVIGQYDGISYFMTIVSIIGEKAVAYKCTVGDSGVGQRQVNGTASKNTLQLLELKENQCITSL